MKRKPFGYVLLGLGAFLLVIGILALTWAPGVVKKTPLDVNQTTRLDGTVKKYNTETGKLDENPVKVESITKIDSDASDSSTAVWVQSTCVVIDINNAPDCVDGKDERLVSASTDVFATDRVTAMAVPDYAGLPADAIPHEGLVNKWPFDSEKKTYPFWDGTLNKTVDAVYEGTETIEGIETYKYVATSKDEPIEITEGTDGTYDDVTTIYVEPKTGAIQQQTDLQQRYLTDGTQVLDLDIGFTDAQLQTSADDARSNLQLLNLVLVWLPIIGLGGGLICLIAGALLLISARRKGPSGGAPSEPEPAAAAV